MLKIVLAEKGLHMSFGFLVVIGIGISCVHTTKKSLLPLVSLKNVFFFFCFIISCFVYLLMTSCICYGDAELLKVRAFSCGGGIH